MIILSKKSGIGVIFLLLLSLGVIFLGYRHAANQKEEMMAQANGAQQDKKEETAKEKNLNTDAFEEKRDQLSIVDYITYLQQQKDETTISFYGQLADEEKWPEEVKDFLEEQTGKEVNANRLTKEKTDTYQLAVSEDDKDLTETKTDVVFYLLPSIGDKKRDISLDDSSSYIERSIKKIQKALPESLIVAVTPHPDSSELGNRNSRTLDYTAYMERGIKAAEEMELPIFDLHKDFQEQLDDDKTELGNYLTSDGDILNSKGTALQVQLFQAFLSEPIDTTSGI